MQHLRDSLRTVDGLRVFAKGRRDGNLVQVLKMTESRRARWSAPGDEEHRGAVEIRVADPGERVHVRHAAACGAYAHGSAEASDGFGDISRGLFVAHVHKPHSRPVTGVVQVVQAMAAKCCDKADAFFLKFRHQQVRTVHARLQWNFRGVLSVNSLQASPVREGRPSPPREALCAVTRGTGPTHQWRPRSGTERGGRPRRRFLSAPELPWRIYGNGRYPA